MNNRFDKMLKIVSKENITHYSLIKTIKNIMTTIHLTKSVLESEKALYQHWLNDCDDFEHCEQYQETIDAIDEALRTGEGTSFSSGCTKYVMDSSSWAETL